MFVAGTILTLSGLSAPPYRYRAGAEPYSPECEEGDFCELRLLGILGSSLPVRYQCLKIRNLRDTLLYLMGIEYIRIMDR
jgi:hypothetical protein